jgi:serine protease
MDLVAPGGGSDAPVPEDPTCAPGGVAGRDISGVSFRAGAPSRFKILPKFRGTSNAAPHVTGVAALVLASGLLGSRPTPAAVERHLEATARDLGPAGRDRYYGAGLVDAAAATAPRPAPAAAGTAPTRPRGSG